MSYTISLSTMWAKGRFSHMKEFATKAKEWGFTHIEANSIVSPQMLDELVDDSMPISSLHCPCPNRPSSTGVPAASLSLSSLDEAERREAIRFAQDTIDVASRIGARAVVLHLGEVPLDLSLQDKLYQLRRQGHTNSKEYNDVRERLISQRASRASQYVDAAEQSLRELSRHSKQRGIVLGVETRFYFHEIPNIDEMERVLNGMDNNSVGYWHDMGHAEVRQRLGFSPHEEWLSRFKNRMIGIHLHDVLGITDHYCPGRGDVDWSTIAKHLPQEVIKVCEIGEWNDEKYMPQALPFLYRKRVLA